MVAIIEKRDLRDFDWLTAMLAVAIAAFGVWQIHNALPSESYWSKQIIGIGIAFVAFLVIAFNDYRRIIDAAPFFYVAGLILLFLVLTPQPNWRSEKYGKIGISLYLLFPYDWNFYIQNRDDRKGNKT